MLLETNRDDGESWNNLALALQGQAQHAAAIRAHRMALRIFAANDQDNISQSHSGFAMSLLYADGVKRQELFQEHLQAGSYYHETDFAYPGTLDPDRRLKIGYCSWDFREHSCMYFTLPFLRRHDHERFEVYGYYDAPKRDHYTDAIEGMCDHWRQVEDLSDWQWAEKIREDGIDILVDLSGHTSRRQMNVFAWRAAPVQVMYVGYPETSGLPTMDYRIVDAVTDPVGAEQWATECLVRLPRCFLCYEPVDTMPEVIPERPDHPMFTFGSFNNYAKMNDAVIERWAEILRQTPNSRLIIKNNAMRDRPTRELCVGRFKRWGVKRRQLELIGKLQEKPEHFAMYGQIDLALDTFPYNGTTTTCEAIYTGTPVLTFLGNRHSARVSASILKAIGVPELIAEDEVDYVRKAVAIGKGRVKVPRGTSLREQMQHSMLMDAESMTQVLERVLREIWVRHCQMCSQTAQSPEQTA